MFNGTFEAKLFNIFTDNREKARLLILVPNSWTTGKTMSYFSVFKRCISGAREYRNSNGIFFKSS